MSENETQERDPNVLLSSKQALEELEVLWGFKISSDAFRMLRYRRRNDPSMPRPAFTAGENIILWRRGDLQRIKPPQRRTKPEAE
ncbi:MAG: hypothetical protein H0W02_10300 [Ktedonobacteraceae bacterium]|nr:hypothetical protein [Ktedonobacteraceae bacterium]